MKINILKLNLIFFLLFYHWQVEAQIILPIEVLGEINHTVSVSFNIDNPTTSTTLWIQANNLSYQDKGSVMINQSAWIPFNNTKCKVQMPEKAFGGIGGGYSTVRFSLDLPQNILVNGFNKIYFKFNSSDGFSIGYRVINFNIQSSAGTKLIGSNQFTEDSPLNWAKPAGSNEAAGKDLWYGSKPLKQSYLIGSKVIFASCSDCHAENGRDLKYFQYSNKSIIKRSEFHGLSEQEGKDVAAYIRSLSTPAPGDARPWNPPYQPGPGLDSKPVSEWAAGAGLQWALDDDQQTLPYLFPNGIKQGMDITRVLNIREIPIALQLPDWKHWLPKVHPKDIYGQDFMNQEPVTKYNEVRNQLKTNQGLTIQQKAGLVDDLKEETEDFMGGENMWGITGTFGITRGPLPCSTNPGMGLSGGHTHIAFTLPRGNADCEDIMLAMNHWNAVKHWEIMQEFDLEDKANLAYPSNGGIQRAWLGNERRTVFELAPHRSANNSVYFKGSDKVTGDYFSTAWYQLQLVLNAGNKSGGGFFPVDWNYHFLFQIDQANSSKLPQHLRQTLSLLYSFQMMNNGKFGYDGWWPHINSPSYFMFANQDFGNSWTKIDPCQRITIAEQFMQIFISKGQSFSDAQWDSHRANPINSNGQIPHKDYIPSSQTINGNYADQMFQSIYNLKVLGARTTLIDSLATFGKRLWPKGDWEAERIRPFVNPKGMGDGLNTKFFVGTSPTGTPAKTIVSANVNLAFGPNYNPITQENNDDPFSTEWTGYITPYFTQKYIFSLRADDGVRMWIDDIQIVDYWSDGVRDITTSPVYLELGKNYKIKIQHFDNTGDAAIKLYWETSSVPCGINNLSKELVPQSQLFTNACYDFIISGIKTVPENIKPNSPFEVEFIVKNDGNVTSPKNGIHDNFLSITYKISGKDETFGWTGFHNYMNAKEEISKTAGFQGLPAGNYDVLCWVDDINRHPDECNENNFFTFPIVVSNVVTSIDNELEKSNHFSVSPNPFSEETILKSFSSNYVEVYDNVGKLIENKANSEYEYSLGKSWKPGIYFIKINGRTIKAIKY